MLIHEDLNMVQSVCWNFAFVFGLFFTIFGVMYIIKKKGTREEHFIKAGVFEFVAIWIMYIPDELFNDIPDSAPILKEIECFFTAFLRAFNIYLGNGYERVSFDGKPVFSVMYSIVLIAANIVLLFLVVGLIAYFLEGPLNNLKLTVFKNRYSYIFPVCNEKTIAIARSINNEKCNIIFTDIENGMESHCKQFIKNINGIYVKNSIVDVIRIIGINPKGIEVFLFDNNEEKNLTDLEMICYSLDKNREPKMRLFVELSSTPWDLYDSFLKEHCSVTGEGLVINFVRMEENFAYNNLLKNSIFSNAIESGKGGIKDIHFLLVGMNERNLEMFKALLHLGQMPRYNLSIMVLDEEFGRADLKSKMPEVYDSCEKEGDAIYRILYHEGVDFATEQFEDMIKNEFLDFTFAFVNVGDDLLNARLSLRLNALCYREGKDNNYKIQTNIYKNTICEEWDENLTKNIEFVGDINTTYSHRFVTMSDIEKGTIAIHEVRYPKNSDRYRSWIDYCNNEYNRHSVYARTLSFKYKVQIIRDSSNPSEKLETEENWDIYKVTSEDKSEWKVYEHMRWNMYTRTMGYVLAKKYHIDSEGKLDSRMKSVAKVHNDLVDYEMLPIEEQAKDALKLTPDVVKILLEL